MGISERKEREKEDLRKKILEAAKGLFLEKGYDQTSIRNIAEKIEYSPTTIYLYFKDKDSIFYALHSEGFCLFNNRMSVLQSVADPFERLKAMGKIYIEFCKENKELYDLMFIQESPMNCLEENNESWDEGKASFTFLKQTVSECMDKGYFPENDVEATSFFIWSTMHGMCSLQIRNRTCQVISESNQENIVEYGYSVLISMLENLKTKN